MSLASWTYIPEGLDTDPLLYGATHYSELKGSGNVSTTPGNPGVDRIFLVHHSSIPQFLDDLIGWSEVKGDGSGVGGANSPPIVRSLPDPHPIYTNMYCSEASAVGEGALSQYVQKYAKYDVGIVTAKYKSLDYPVLADTALVDKSNELERFVTRQYGFGGEIITIGNTGMRYVNNTGSDGKGTTVNQPPGKPTMTVDMTYTWHWVPVQNAAITSQYIPPNITNIIACYGKVNSTIFDAEHMDCPPGTVLFMGVEPRLTNYRIGTVEDANDGYSNIYWEIAMKFLYRNNGLWIGSAYSPPSPLATYNGHNFIWDQANERYDLITTTGNVGGNTLYQSADLNKLFTIG